MSGTLRTTLDVFNEYEDAEIVRTRASATPMRSGLTERVQYEALRRVHLIPTNDVSEEDEGVNANVFRNLDSSVSEGGENFSTG